MRQLIISQARAMGEKGNLSESERADAIALVEFFNSGIIPSRDVVQEKFKILLDLSRASMSRKTTSGLGLKNVLDPTLSKFVPMYPHLLGDAVEPEQLDNQNQNTGGVQKVVFD